ARLTISMARSTPAQKPRGLASRTSMGGNSTPPRPYRPRTPVGGASARAAAAGGLALDEAEHGDADGAADDGRVGDVERRPVPVAPVPLDEIDHVAVDEAVDDVADRPA